MIFDIGVKAISITNIRSKRLANLLFEYGRKQGGTKL